MELDPLQTIHHLEHLENICYTKNQVDRIPLNIVLKRICLAQKREGNTESKPIKPIYFKINSFQNHLRQYPINLIFTKVCVMKVYTIYRNGEDLA